MLIYSIRIAVFNKSISSLNCTFQIEQVRNLRTILLPLNFARKGRPQDQLANQTDKLLDPNPFSHFVVCDLRICDTKCFWFTNFCSSVSRNYRTGNVFIDMSSSVLPILPCDTLSNWGTQTHLLRISNILWFRWLVKPQISMPFVFLSTETSEITSCPSFSDDMLGLVFLICCWLRYTHLHSADKIVLQTNSNESNIKLLWQPSKIP